MKIRFLSATESGKNCKCSITAYGMLKFNVESIDYMGLSENKSFLIGVDEEATKFNDKLYLAELENGDASETKSAIKTKRTGKTFSLPIATICDQLKLDYKKKLISFTILKNDAKYNKKVVFTLSATTSKERTKYKSE
jgi:hypothetical protein